MQKKHQVKINENIKLGFYNPKYEKKKIVKVTKISKKYVWFEHSSGRYKYSIEDFKRNFVLTLDK